MSNEKKTEEKDSNIAENAATTYGLEDHEATAEDPRVFELKSSRSHQRRLQNSAKAPARTLSPSVSQDNTVVKRTPAPNSIRIIENPDNAAANHGLEDPKTSQKDPRFGNVVDPKKTSPPAIVPTSMAPTSATSSQNQLNTASPQPGDKEASSRTVPPPLRSNPPDENNTDVPPKAKPIVMSTLTNTDVTFDPSKEYASKTTNTSGQLYTDAEEPEPEPEPTPPPPPPPVVAGPFDLDECYEFAVALVRKAGAIALASNKERLSYTTKEHEKDLNTRTDIEVEAMMTSAISDKYPNHKIIAEETVSQSETGQVTLTNEPTWIIDPIDGTMNYVHHFPYYCIALAFFIDKNTQFGIVFNPPLQEFYTARNGKGAELNNAPMTTSGQEVLKKAMILQEYSSGMNEARTATSMDNAKTLIKKTHALRSIGSSAMGLAMVASGVADAFYFFGLHVWDMAAGNILVTEAGGCVIDPAGGEVDIMSRRVLAAATKPLAIELSNQLTQNYPMPRDDQPRNGGEPEMKDFQAQTEFSDSSLSLDSDSSRQIGNYKA